MPVLPTSYASARAIGTAVLVVVAACAQGPVEPKDPAIRTDRTEYPVTRQGGLVHTTIHVTYVNRTGGPRYLPARCGLGTAARAPALEKRRGDRWVSAVTPIDELCVAGYVMVPPGETYTYSHRMTAALPGTNAGPTFDTLPIGGTYRLVWDLHEPRPGTSVLRQVRPLERVSNSFRLYELGPEAPPA